MDHKTDESKVLSNTDNVLTENLSQSIQVNSILQNKKLQTNIRTKISITVLEILKLNKKFS